MPLAGIAAENQVDTIADKNYRYPFNMLPSILAKLVSNAFEEYAVERIRRTELIVDSQAQKIAEQAMQIEKLAGLNHVAEAQIERQAMQIAEQAKEIERLTASANQAKSFDVVMGGPGAPGYDGEPV